MYLTSIVILKYILTNTASSSDAIQYIFCGYLSVIHAKRAVFRNDVLRICFGVGRAADPASAGIIELI
jgi:hypothetical protein